MLGKERKEKRESGRFVKGEMLKVSEKINDCFKRNEG